MTHLLTKWGALDDVLLRFPGGLDAGVYSDFLSSFFSINMHNLLHFFAPNATEVVDSRSLRHVLEGLKLEELESLNNSGYLPDKFNAWKSCAVTWSKV